MKAADDTNDSKPRRQATRLSRPTQTIVKPQSAPNVKEAAEDAKRPSIDVGAIAEAIVAPVVERKLLPAKIIPPAPTETASRAITTLTIADAADSPEVPATPAAPPATLTDLLGWAWREINRTFNNQTPTLAYKPSMNKVLDDGRIEGNLESADADGDALNYTATDPAHGDVVIHPDGTFTYTPDAGYTGYDSFDVTVSDAGNGFHIHGLSGLVNLVTFGLVGSSGDTVTQTITVGTAQTGPFTATPVVSGLDKPTDFRVLPDGRILVTEKDGTIQVVDKDGHLQSTPAMQIDTPTVWARGLLAVEVDPDYAENGYIYVSYVEKQTGHERLSRLTVTDPDADVLTIDPASELVLVEGDEAAGDDHLGGGLGFGPDGMLYWSVGDNVCCSVVDGSRAQNPSKIYGKVLRVNPDGDNPYQDPEGVASMVYASGFRNPYRLSFTPEGDLLVADVGQSTWEEVNLVKQGGNYGWPNAEGSCSGIGTTSCSTPSSYDNPIYAYRHNGSSSITGVMEYTGPGTRDDQHTVLISDFNQGWVKELTFNSDYSSVLSERVLTDAAPGSTNQLIQDSTGNIYQLSYSSGTLYLLTPTVDV